jgi:hypothetical protein
VSKLLLDSSVDQNYPLVDQVLFTFEFDLNSFEHLDGFDYDWDFVLLEHSTSGSLHEDVLLKCSFDLSSQIGTSENKLGS